MLEVFGFYLETLQKIFVVMMNFELFPGINFLMWISGLAIVVLLVNIIKGNYDDERKDDKK